MIAISDGDTLKARCTDAGATTTTVVRLAEIDAPEKGQPFGRQSKQSLAALCFQKQATIRPHSKDRYGRTVARVECDGQDASAEQVRSGMAWAYTKYLTDQSIMGLELQARAERRGLWAYPNPVAPWDYRKR